MSDGFSEARGVIALAPLLALGFPKSNWDQTRSMETPGTKLHCTGKLKELSECMRSLSARQDLFLDLGLRWQRKARLVKQDTSSVAYPSKCYFLEDKVCSDTGQSVSQKESVQGYTAEQGVQLTSKPGSTSMLIFT